VVLANSGIAIGLHDSYFVVAHFHYADEVGSFIPGVHRVNTEVPTRMGDGCSSVRGAPSPCWTTTPEIWSMKALVESALAFHPRRNRWVGLVVLGLGVSQGMLANHLPGVLQWPSPRKASPTAGFRM
jgi:hypothetical protein